MAKGAIASSKPAFHKGILLLDCGRAATRFCTPLVITSEQIVIAVDILADILDDSP